MGKLQSDGGRLSVMPPHSTLRKQEPDIPPQIPPRMKKKGPALPEKPPHIRAKSNVRPDPSSQPPREPLKPRVLNLDRFPPGTQREVLVAASKSGRERPVEKRQREPAKLLMPTSSGKKSSDLIMPTIHLEDKPPSKREVQSKALLRLEEILPTKRDIVRSVNNPLWSTDEMSSLKKSSAFRKSRPVLQPVLLIPRNLLTWGSSPVSYALWASQRDLGRGAIRQSTSKSSTETSGTSAVRLRSNSVTRSGSLTSQGSSSSSESGVETFPKSVLKKQRRAAAPTSNLSSKGTQANRRVDQKKNVTFNAFATVQLMEE